MMNRPLAISAALLAALPFSASAAEKRAFAIADLYAVKGVAEPAIAPDGRSVAFAVTTTDLPAIRRQTNVWRVDADGKNARALTVTDKRDARRDRFAFLSTRAGDPQVFFLPTGAARRRKRPTCPAESASSSSRPTASASSSPPRCGPSAAPTRPATARRTRPWRRGR